MATKYPGNIITLNLQCRSKTNNSIQQPITSNMEVSYRCREDWFLIAGALPVVSTASIGMYTFTYTLSNTVYSDPSDANQKAEEIRFRFNYTTTAGSFHKDIFFDYSTA